MIVGLVVCVSLAGLLWFGYIRSHHPVIPEVVSARAKYGLFYPEGDSAIVIQRPTVKYDQSISQVSFVAEYNADKLTFSEQATPEDFYASQDYYNNLITKMGGYYTFQNALGTIHLTNDKSLGRQVGVMDSKGTLIFVTSAHTLSNNNWREVFNSLVYRQGK